MRTYRVNATSFGCGLIDSNRLGHGFFSGGLLGANLLRNGSVCLVSSLNPSRKETKIKW